MASALAGIIWLSRWCLRVWDGVVCLKCLSCHNLSGLENVANEAVEELLCLSRSKLNSSIFCYNFTSSIALDFVEMDGQ